MPPCPNCPTPLRSRAVVLNAAIRALVRARGPLEGDDRAEYDALVVEWTEADRAERAAHGGAELAA